MEEKRVKFYKDGNMVVTQLKEKFMEDVKAGRVEGLVAQDKS